MTSRHRTLIVCGAGIFLVIALQAALHLARGLAISDYGRLAWFVALWGVACAIYVPACIVSLRTEGRTALLIALVGAAFLRVVPLAMTPFLSTDLYRYVWDGRVQNAGINPYCCIPSAPELETLQDDAIYPFINRSDYAPTIYPPVAQMLFAAVTLVSQSVVAMKLAMALAEAVAIAAMVVLLGTAGMPGARVLIYAWNPVVIWEYAGSGHIDVAGIAFTGLALLAAARGRQAWTGVALAGAALTKFVPVVVGPAMWKSAGAGLRGWFRLPVAFAISVIAAYACFASVGMKVFGFLGGYASEEGLTGGSGIYALQILSNVIAVPQWAAPAWLGLVAAALVGLSLRMIVRHGDGVAAMARDALLLLTVTIVGISPHYAWYFGGLAYLSCICARPSVVWLTIACAAVYLDTVHANSGWSNLVYGPFLCLALNDLRHGHFGRSECLSRQMPKLRDT